MTVLQEKDYSRIKGLRTEVRKKKEPSMKKSITK